MLKKDVLEVELLANGISLGKKQAAHHFFYFEVPNAGETKLEAIAGDCRDESVIRKVDTRNPNDVLRDQGAVLNWFDITEIEGRFSLNVISAAYRHSLYGHVSVLYITSYRSEAY